MKDTVKYKEYIGSVQYSSEDEVFYGRLEGIRDLVTFEGNSVDELNKAFSEHEKVLRFRIVKESWSPETGDLSPTLKLKRKVVSERNKALIDSMYGN